MCFVGIVVGCAAATVAPIMVGKAQAAGQWRCFATDELGEPEEAASWGGAVKATDGLNAVAQHTPAGTVLNLQWNAKTSVTCVKY